MAMLERWGDILVAAWQASPAPRNLLTKADGSKEIVVEGLQVRPPLSPLLWRPPVDGCGAPDSPAWPR